MVENQALLKELEEQEKKDLKNSFFITFLLILFLIPLLIVWNAVMGTIPPPEDEQYEVAGSIDFGNYTEGSKKINNFEAPSETPSEEPEADPEPTPVVEEASQPVTNTNEQIITTEAEEAETETVSNTQPVENPKPSITPKVSEPVKETPKEKEQPKTETVTETKTVTKPKAQTGGSDHGDSNTPGNRGRDDTQVLDPNGMYTFGEGGNGLHGRKPLDLPNPRYLVQQEARLKFEFIISPDGTVKYVKPPITSNIGLKKAGMDAIYKWKFEPVPDGEGDQKTSVSITFKLK